MEKQSIQRIEVLPAADGAHGVFVLIEAGNAHVPVNLSPLEALDFARALLAAVRISSAPVRAPIRIEADEPPSALRLIEMSYGLLDTVRDAMEKGAHGKAN